MKVFVVDKNNKPLMPTHPAKARMLLKHGNAQIVKLEPFVIKLNYAIENEQLQKIKVGIDDGAKEAGIAIVVEKDKRKDEVLFVGTLVLTNNIKDKMDARRGFRRVRRNRLKYRKPRFNNRVKTKCAVCGKNAQKGHDVCRLHKGTKWYDKYHKSYWLPPSIKAKKDYIIRTINQLNKWIPINQIIIETGRFDIQKLINPNISGEDYQKGPRYEKDSLKAALIAEYGKKIKDNIKIIAFCCYCGKEDVPLEVEHIIPRGKGGTNAWHNLTLACKSCNDFKGNRTPEEAGMKLIVKPLKLNQTRILKYATQLQQGKNYLRQSIADITGIMPAFTYGQFTSWQRKKFDIPKTHINDAIIVAITTYDSENKPKIPKICCDEYHIKAMGTKSRAIFTATHYSPKDYSYRDKDSKKRKRINSLEGGVKFDHTIRALKEINRACVLISDNNKIKALGIKTFNDIPKDTLLTVEKGDVVESKIKNKVVRGRVAACMSKGNIKILNNNQELIAVSLKNTRLISKKENIIFQKIS